MNKETISKTEPTAMQLANDYAQTFQRFARTQQPDLKALDLILSFDGEPNTPQRPKFPPGFLDAVIDYNNSHSMGLENNPIIQLVDSLFAYLLYYPDALIHHNAQAQLALLYQNIHAILVNYEHSKLQNEAARSQALNQIRAAVWDATKTRSHGYFYNACWLFLARTAQRKRATFFSLPTVKEIHLCAREDINFCAQQGADEVMFQAHFPKAIEARQLNPSSWKFVLTWFARVLKKLFSSIPDLVLEDKPTAQTQSLDGNDPAQLSIVVRPPSEAELAAIVTTPAVGLPLASPAAGSSPNFFHSSSSSLKILGQVSPMNPKNRPSTPSSFFNARRGSGASHVSAQGSEVSHTPREERIFTTASSRAAL